MLHNRMHLALGNSSNTTAPAPAFSGYLDYGWFGGGVDGSYYSFPTSLVDRIDYATDTATASVRGPLSQAREPGAATGTLSYGWFGGGYAGTVADVFSTVDRIDYATDTATASVRGSLSATRAYLAATGTSSYGWFGGGTTGSSVSTVDRIDYANDTATAGVRGSISAARFNLSATGTSSYGWFGAGSDGDEFSTVDRIDYANDTATASVRGPLSAARSRPAATGTSSYGWFGGGSTSLLRVSTIDRIDYATDTTTANVRGPLSAARSRAAATGTSSYGWFGGGDDGSFGTYSSTVDRIDYATDTATASVRGPLSMARNGLAATQAGPLT